MYLKKATKFLMQELLQSTHIYSLHLEHSIASLIYMNSLNIDKPPHTPPQNKKKKKNSKLTPLASIEIP